MSNPLRIAMLREAARKRPHVKLDEQKASEIRLSVEPTRVLSERYGISMSLVNKVRAGVAWVPAETQHSPWGGLLK